VRPRAEYVLVHGEPGADHVLVDGDFPDRGPTRGIAEHDLRQAPAFLV
jgi:hypothetical protein